MEKQTHNIICQDCKGNGYRRILIEEGREEVIHEVADLWFHLLVLLRYENITIDEIESELDKRFGISGHDEKASRESK